jgi:beta-glucosidase/6-phospho-beta-glucosidase/beta-galactosidase
VSAAVTGRLALPPEFRFGVATAGFQVEGGYNGPGEPANNWAEWERSGRVEPSGIALDFWGQYEHHLDRAVAAGCDGYRLSVEWARCQPAPNETDRAALDAYAAILGACRSRGLQPLVTLHHFTHPHWLGVDFWLGGDAPQRFAAWVGTAVAALAPHCRHWVTINEVNVYAMQSYLNGLFPPGRRGDARAMARCFDHLTAAHVLAYDAIHAVQPDAVVATNNYSFSAYEPDRMLSDVLLARSAGVERVDLRRWLASRKEDFARSQPAHGLGERAVRRLAATLLPVDTALPRTVDAVYASPHERTLDVAQIDFYDPRVDRKFRMPGHRTAGGRNWLPGRMLWDDPPDPPVFTDYCGLSAVPGCDLWVAENGLCNRVRRGVSLRRLDGWDRVRYLRANLGAMMDAIDGGVPITGYYHWCLADNYEWGSYEPRFGLYGIDRERGVRWSDVDSMGGAAAATYAEIIAGLRAGDRSVLLGAAH